MSKKWTGTPKKTDKQYMQESANSHGGAYVEEPEESTIKESANLSKNYDKKKSMERQAKINKDRKARIAKAKARRNSK